MLYQIIPAGAQGYGARWMYVTKVGEDGRTVTGRLWSARAQRWTKGASTYARDAVFNAEPRCAKPPPPLDGGRP